MATPETAGRPHESVSRFETPGQLLVGREGCETGAQFRELMAHLQHAFWIKNAADTAVLYISPAYETIWGRSRSSLYDNSHSFLDSVHAEDRERVAAAMSGKHLTGGYEEEYRIVRPDGAERWVWARAYPVRDEQGEIRRYAGIAEDVSERKWAEKERSRLAAIIELAEDSVVNTTLDGTIIAWNQGAERKYGYAAEEILGYSMSVLIPSERTQEYLDVMKKVRAGDAVPSYETVRRRKDGALINLSVSIAPIEARDGKVVGVSKIGQDMSRVKKLQAQLIEAQKMEIIGQLTGGVAHDFNNILGVILGYSDLIMQELEPDHALRRSVAAIRHAAERGAGLTRQLLIFSRQETVQFATLSLNEVLGNMDGMLRQLIDESIELSITPGLEIGQVNADLGYIEQVLMNLVVNARDAMPGGGKLLIGTNNVTLDEAYASLHPGITCGDYVMLSVSDTGMGMSDIVKARLFEPFFTTKPKGKGTGLGLATCQTIVKKCGGHIEISSEAGKGTTFKIYFPRVDAPTVSTARPFPASPLPRGTEKILVVEDDSDMRELVCGLLRSQGYEVVAAHDGEDGLRAVLNQQGQAIRLVVSDVIMPRMGGQMMAEDLAVNNPELKILFTSGYTDDVIAHHGLLDPSIAFLSKPYSVAALARKVRGLLDSSGVDSG